MPDSINPENAQNLINFLKRLRAVRQFRPDPVPQEVINAVLEVVRWSGSAGNRQPWEVVLIRNKETLHVLSAVEGYASHLAGASLGIVLVMAGDHGQVDQETYDEGRLSERIMLAAAAYGVGSSIGWFRRSGMTDAKAILGIPQERLVRTAISLGYTDEDARRARPKHLQARKQLSDIVHDERYGLHQHHQE
ncbi:MAG TPA: nitroreductase family protein [Ktedonobacteraceae bacterium]